VSASRPNLRPSIPYPSRMQDQKLRDKANDQREKFFQIFKDLNFNSSFSDALILMLKFGPSIKSLLTNKDKLYELVRTPLNEHCSAVLLKKLPKKLGDQGMFLIPCDFPGMAECLALADLGANINLMLLSMWNKLSLPDLFPTCMTLELADRSISHSVRIAEDVYVNYLRVSKEAITFNLDQTSRYSANYNEMMVNRIDVIDMACEEYSQEVLGFSDVIASGPTIPTTSSSSPIVERDTEVTKDTMHPTNNGSTEDVQPLVFQYESPILTFEPVNSPIIEPVASPVSASRPNLRPSIPYPSRMQDQKLRDKANDQREKFFQIFKDLNFNTSFSDALILMLKFGPSIKSLLTNKDKLYELVRTPLNEHCSAVLLKKLPKKLGDQGMFL
nr:reverse transcriptase domain-containing protein [Tanacetum cinerariifolium]